MRIKLDENFSSATKEIFQKEGIDVHSVMNENLSGADDKLVYSTCLLEKCCLITFDTDFCDILRFPADQSEGIIVIRPKRPISLQHIKIFALKIVNLVKEQNPKNSLWILDENKLRIRKNE